MYINNFINYLKTDNKSENTLIAYENDLKQMIGFINKSEAEIKLADLNKWKESMNHYSSATKSRKITVTKEYFKYLQENEIVNTNPCKYFHNVKVTNKEKTPLKDYEVRNMIDNARSYRNKAIIITLTATGMRISELANIKLNEYINREENILTITGKGNKTRRIGLADEVCEYIDKYIQRERHDNPIKSNSEYLFVSNQGNKIDRNVVGAMLKNIAQRSKIANWKEISPHYFRTTFATMQLNNNTPLEVVQKQLGHSKITTTLIYAKVADERIINSMAKLNF